MPLKFGIRQKIIGLAVVAALLPLMAVAVNSVSQRFIAARAINTAIDEMLVSDLTRTTRSFYDLCKTANDFTQQYLDHALNVMDDVVARRDGLRLTDESLSWELENQFTGERRRLTIPGMAVGGEPLRRERSFGQWVPVVDDVELLVGATCTIFQRINAEGDMLRVATNVPREDGSRAIGTYVPAVDPDGQPNEVVASILDGRLFRGRAFVVNDWYLTAYRPLRDADDRIIGMLYVGVEQESVESFRSSVLATRVGTHGHLFAIGARGPQRGQWLVAPAGLDGGLHASLSGAEVEGLLEAALARPAGTISIHRQQVGTADRARHAMLAVTGFDAWDLVIGAVAYDEDFRTARDTVEAAMGNLLRHTNLWGLIGLVAVAVLAFVVAVRITGPIESMSMAANLLAEGRSLPAIEADSGDEVAVLADTFNKMARKIGRQRAELETKNDELSAANATKDRFFSIIAHDLKNPLGLLTSYSETLLESYESLDGERIRKGLQTLHANSARGYDLLLELLNWARSQSGNLQVDIGTLDLAKLGRESLDLLAERARQKGIGLELAIPDLLYAQGDGNMVRTILRNLLTNAVKFTGSGGRVTLAARRAGAEIVVEVADTGIGIRPENQQKLFRLDAFYRTAGTEQEKGTGLGLILCKEFVTRMNGQIWVESEEGRGSRFMFSLPVVEG